MRQPDALDRARRALTEVARGVLAEVPGADGAGLTMRLPDGPVHCGANPFTARVEGVQHALGEGPCVTVAESGQLARFRALDDADPRWPRFGAAAVSLPLRDALCVPLLTGTRVIGSLNLYSTREDGFGALDVDDALRLAARVQPAVWNSRTLCVAAANARLLRRAAQENADVERVCCR